MSRPPRRRLASPPSLLAALGLALTPARLAVAAPSESDLRAEALFQDAKTLMAAGNFDAACPKLVEARRLAPGGGTLLALALCREGEGRGATALGLFREALAAATQAKRDDRIEVATEHIRTLEARVSRVFVGVAEPDRAGLEVTLDDAPLERGRFGEGLAVDAGPHVIVAKARGARAWSATVSVAATGDVRRVEIPALQAEPSEARPASTPPALPARDAREERDARWRRPTALVVGGVGLAALGVASFYGVRALSRTHDYQARCPGGDCTEPSSLALHDDAKRDATRSTVLFAVGSALAVGGVVLYLTAPSGAGARAQLAPVIAVGGFGATFTARF